MKRKLNETVLSVDAVAPGLYDGSQELEEDDTAAEDVVDDLVYDVFNLVACDNNELKLNQSGGESVEEVILQSATRATQLLVKRLFDLPTEPTELGPVATLPSQTMRFPREKKIPEVAGETVWEKFARDKGIKKKKRERMVYDDLEGEFRPRYGYKGANSRIEEHAIVEVKSGQDEMEDPWATARQEKKRRVEKNQTQQLRNIDRLAGRPSKKNKKIDVYDPSKVPGIPLEVVDKTAKRGKEGVREALKLAQFSTASMGRFDESRKGEPAKKMKGVKRSFRDNSARDLSTEKDSMKAQLRIVEDKVDKKKRNVTNSLAPYEGILPDAPSDSFKQKKGKGKVLNDSGKKKIVKNK